MKILYAGDSPAGGSANYLLGILKSIRAEVTHVPPSKTLSPKLLKKRFDAMILSDYSKDRVGSLSEKMMIGQVERGAGFLMVGGWASFSAPYGRWRGTAAAKMLPVDCLGGDDRTNFPGGAVVILKNEHAMFGSLSFRNPPVICGLNEIRPKRGSLTVLSAKKIVAKGSGLKTGREYPLLVADKATRVAALATDAAPHWCGGLVDWGRKRVKISLDGGFRVEVGQKYVELMSSLVLWLAGKND
jgi:uncharacterized membrane protein